MAVSEVSASSNAEEYRFRTIFEQSPVSTQIFAPDGWTLAVNRAWERLWGVTLVELGEYNILQDEQLVVKGLMPAIRRAFDGEAADLPAIKYEPAQTAIVPGAVPYRWVRASIYPAKDEAGNIREVVLMHEDITEQIEAEAALRDSELRFRAMFDGAPIGISLLDLEGHYLAVNPVRQEMLGYFEEELIGRSFQEFTDPEDLAYDATVNTEAREHDRGRFQLEKRFVRRDGAIRWARVTVSMLRDEAGVPLYSVAITEDITERKEAEEERMRLLEREREARRRVELLAAEREVILGQKDEFLSALAHDLRTPLTGIRGRVQLMRQRLARDGAAGLDRLEQDLTRIEGSTTRITALIGELLDVANIQIGRPPVLDLQPTDLVALAREAVDDHRQVSPHPVRFISELPEPENGLPELVGCWDRTRLERVLANLLSNAAKYSPEGEEITVTVSREDQWAELRVTDRGIGIPEDDLAAIFDRFQRGSNAPGRVQGTGIGLTIVRTIVQEHGGDVVVTSREGEGSTFAVRLPLGM